MDQIFHDERLTIQVDQTKSIFYWKWSKESALLTEEEFIDYSKKILGFILQHPCENGVENAVEFQFIITPDIQKIIAQQIIEKGRGAFKKLAHITSSDFVSQLSVEQLWKEYSPYNYQERYFSDPEEAMDWILGRKNDE